MALTTKSKVKCHGGSVEKYSFASKSNACDMTFQVFFPSAKKPVPMILWLSGLTCNEDNFLQKGGAIPYFEREQIAVVCPDTSTRVVVPGDDEHWDFGRGASYYVNATEEPFKKNYQMFVFFLFSF
jgi:S-formylglutathione hydrolase